MKDALDTLDDVLAGTSPQPRANQGRDALDELDDFLDTGASRRRQTEELDELDELDAKLAQQQEPTQGAAADTAKRVGRSLVDQPGALTQSLGTFLDAAEKSLRVFGAGQANAAAGFQPAKIRPAPERPADAIQRELDRPSQTGRIVGETAGKAINATARTLRAIGAARAAADEQLLPAAVRPPARSPAAAFQAGLDAPDLVRPRSLQKTGRSLRETLGGLYDGDFAPDPARDQTLLAQVADSSGSLAAAIATPGGVLAKTFTGALLNSQGAADEAEQILLARGATPQAASDEAARQFVLNLPAGALEALPLNRLIGRYGKSLETALEARFGKTAVRRIAGATTEQAVGGGGEETLQQLAQNAAAKATFDPERRLSEGVAQSALVGGVLGAGLGGGAQVTAEALNAGLRGSRRGSRLTEMVRTTNAVPTATLDDTGLTVPESRATLLAQQEQLRAGERPAQMFPTGTEELPLPEGFRRVETPRGVFHFDAGRVTAEQIAALSEARRENELLGLGPLSKDDIAATGEQVATVTESTPGGTEVRAAVTTPSAEATTTAAVRRAASPGNTVRTESVVDVIRRRAAAATVEQQAAQEQEISARQTRAAEKQSRRESFDGVLQIARRTFVRRNEASTPEIVGALNAMRFFAEDNSVGLLHDQRRAAAQATRVLQGIVDKRQTEEAGIGAARNRARLADQATAVKKQTARARADQAAVAEAEAQGIGASGMFDPTVAPLALLERRAAEGDERAAREIMRREDRGAVAGANPPFTLLDLFKGKKAALRAAGLDSPLRLLAPAEARARGALGGEHAGLREQAGAFAFFARDGLVEDKLQEKLNELGFSAPDVQSAYDLVARAIAGEDVRPERIGAETVGEVQFARRNAAGGTTDHQEVKSVFNRGTFDRLDARTAFARRAESGNLSLSAELRAQKLTVISLPSKPVEGTTAKEMRTEALAQAADFLNRPITNEETGAQIVVTKTSLTHGFSRHGLRHIFVVPALPELLRTARLVATEPHAAGAPDIKAVQRYIAALRIGTQLHRVKLTVFEKVDGSRLYDHEATEIETPDGLLLPGRTPVGTLDRGPSSGAEVTIGQLFGGVKPGETVRFSVATETTTIARTAAEIDARWQAMQTAFPEIATEWELAKGDVNRVLRAAGFTGDVPETVQAAIVPPALLAEWRRTRASRGLVVFGADILTQPGKDTRLLLHELGHRYWDTLPGDTKQALADLHTRELATRTGPLFDSAGNPRTEVAFLPDEFADAELARDPELPLREWFAERLALANDAWAAGRVNSRDSLIARLAFELRQLLQRIQQIVAERRGRRTETALLEREFRRFLRQGAKDLDVRGRETAREFARAAFAGAAPDTAQFARGRPPRRPPRAVATVEADLAHVDAELASLANTTAPEADQTKGDTLTKRRQTLSRELAAARREKQASAALRAGDDPALQRQPDPLAGATVVPAVVPADRQVALRAELQRALSLAADGQASGNLEAIAEGQRVQRLATARLDDEFPGWRTAPAPPQAAPTAPPTPGAAALIEVMNNAHLVRDFAQRDALRATLDARFPDWRDTIAGLRFREGILIDRFLNVQREGSAAEIDAAQAEIAQVREQLRQLGGLPPAKAAPTNPTALPPEPATADPTPIQDPVDLSKAQPNDTEQDPFAPPPEQIEAQATAAKRAELEGQSTADPTWFTKPWESIRRSLRAFRGAVPELPAFPFLRLAQRNDPFLQGNPAFYNRMKLGLRLLRTSNEFVQRTAEDQVAAIVRPLLAAGRGSWDANAYARLRRRQQKLRQLREENKPLPPGIEAEIGALQSKLADNPLMLFQRTVLYLDLDWRAKNLRDEQGNPIALPMSLTPAETTTILEELSQRVAASPHAAIIGKAIEQHMALVKQIADDLGERGLLAPAHLANPFYFPHIVIDGIAPNLAQVKETTNADFRGYLITPVGSRKPIETDYIRATYFHLVQVHAHNTRADITRQNFQSYDVMADVRAAAERLGDRYGRAVSWREAFHTEFADSGYELYGAGDGDAFAAVQVDRDRLAQRLGVALTEGPLADQLARLGAQGIKLLPEDFREISLAGEREIWVLPSAVAEALRGMQRRAELTPGPIERGLTEVQGLWKKNILFAPWNYLRYEFNNTSSDLEKLVSADPEIFRRLPSAARELRDFYDGGPASPELAQALRLGVLQSITANELSALPELRAFDELQTTGQRVAGAVGARLSSLLLQPVTAPLGLGDRNTLRLSQLREGVFRFAKFEADLERIKNNAQPVYAGAFWRDIEAIQESAPGAGDAAELKAAMISRSTFGDYGDLSVAGQQMRNLTIPFFSWIEINFRYHANLFRNYRDAVTIGEMTQADAVRAGARAGAVVAASLTRRAAAAFLLRLALPYAAVTLWNTLMHADIEDELSEEDKRRFHLNIGRRADGRSLVLYVATAFADVAKWFGGPEFARLSLDYARGRTDLGTAFAAWRDRLAPDVLNNTLQSGGPAFRAPYTLLSGSNTFPDVLNQRTIPKQDMFRVILGQMTDQFAAEMIMRAVDKDFYSTRDLGDWARQNIFQLRVRDTEQWAFYEVKDRASAWVAERTRTSRDLQFNSPEQKLLRNFRRAIYQGDPENATRFYLRLLQVGYTSDRFEASIRSQDPLFGVPRELRAEFVASLSPFDRLTMLPRAYRYFLSIENQADAARTLFPRKAAGEAGQAARLAAPNTRRLQTEIAQQNRLPEHKLAAAAAAALERSIRPER